MMCDTNVVKASP